MTSLTILKGNKSYLEAYFRRYGIKVAEYTGRPGTGICGQLVLAMSTDISPTLQAYIDYYKYCYDKILSTFHIRPMTELEKIDKRLLLFKEYMKYRLQYWTCIHYDFLKELNPNAFLHFESWLSFDQWLIYTGHADLSELTPPHMYVVNNEPIEKMEVGSFKYNFEGKVIWVKDPNGRWRRAK